MIELINVNKSFEDRQVLFDINAQFFSGKNNLIIGASGGGKSVLMKCMVGLEKPDNGQIEFDKDIGEAKAYQSLGKMKSNAQAARLLVRMIIAIASSDGNFDAMEKKVAVKIAKELGIDPTEFEL